MPNSSNIDNSMLELFVSELEIHTRTLESGLLSLETNSSTQVFESLMRAAHSIKGAARVIGLSRAVELAHRMEDIFESARKTGKTIRDGQIQVLLDITDFYSSLIDNSPMEIPQILELSESKINFLLAMLEKTDQTDESGNQPNENLKKNDLPSSDLQNNNEKVIYKRTSENTQIDITLLDLFKNEIYSNCSTILYELNDDQFFIDQQIIENICKMLNSIKGASKIVGIEEAATIVSEIDNTLRTFNFQKQNLNINNIRNLILLLLEMPDNTDKEIINYFRTINYIDLVNEITSIKPAVVVELTNSIKLPDESSDNTPQIEKREDRFVKVLSENLNKLLGLSGEILVLTKSLKPFSTEMQKIKVGLLELNTFKEQIYHELYRSGLSEEINLKFQESSKQLDFILSLIINYIENFENFSRRLEITSDRLYIESVETRMKPFSEGLYGFPRLVRDISKQLGKKVDFIIKGESTKVDRDILEKLEAPLNHLIRNAIDHGLELPEFRTFEGKSETGKIILEARHSSGLLLITISDDGNGIDLDDLSDGIVRRGFASDDMAKDLSPAELYDFLFLPGFTTKSDVTEISGRGVGLDVVFSMINEVGGTIKVESELGRGTTFQLQLPLTLSVIRTMLVEINNEPYAIPLSRIDRVLSLNFNDLKSVENLHYLEFNGENIGIVNAQQIFGFSKNQIIGDKYHVVVLSDRLNKYGLAVDRLISQPDLVILPLDKKLGRIPNISSGAILEDGTPVLVIDADDVVRSIDNITKSGTINRIADKDSGKPKKLLHILVVDDSLTVREVERKLLENNGYKVTVAVDGIDGWNSMHRDKFDLIISDIDMPRMNGIDMVRRIKSDIKFREIPVMIVSYKDRDEDRRKGMEAGANYYLTKSSFHDDTLLEAVEDLIGKP